MKAKNDWAKSAEFYDLILGKERFRKSASFIGSILAKYGVRDVLEIGCGTGLYLRLLRDMGFRIEGLDISAQMLRQARSIGVKLHRQDMSRFSLEKRYDAILCLNSSLVLLPNMRAIARTVDCCCKHLNPGGLLIIDLPNHEKEIPENDGTEETTRHRTAEGTLILKNSAYRKGKKWVEVWEGRIGKRQFTERFEELIYPPETLEKLLKKEFVILATYGSRTGGKMKKGSYRRVYVCRKRTR